MSYCINPNCRNPENPADTLNFCQSCGSKLSIDEQYRVIRELGQGGFGKTYEVRDRNDARKVLKVLTYNDPKGVELFQKEAIVLQKLRHPGLPIVEPDGYFTFKPNDTSNSLHCLVMEKIEGNNLQQWLESQNYKPIDSQLAIDWLTQLTEVLNLVHNQNYFHRDIKPQNIMRRPNGQLVLIDFGAVREVTETVQRITGEVTRISSAGYTPEEQKKGKAEPRSDFFALGRTFVYLLTAQEPRNLQEDSRSGKLIWRNVATGASKPLADLIDDLMNYFPKDRPQDTQVLLQRLAKMVDRPPSAPQSRRTPAFALGGKQVLMGVGIAGAIATSAFAIQHFSKTQVENLLTYQNSANQFKIKYPEKWEKQESQNPFTPDVVVFISPKKNSADPYQEKITVSIETLEKPMSLDEYNKWSLNQIQTLTDVKILEENAKTVANNSGYAVVFDAKEEAKNMKKMQAWTLINNKAYVFTYTAEKSEYSEYLKTAESVVSSLEIN